MDAARRVSDRTTPATLPNVNGDGASPASTSISGNGAQPTPSQSSKKKVNTFKLKQLQDRCAHLEALVSSTESSIAECEAALQTFVSADETIRLTQLLAQRSGGGLLRILFA